jgi:hypothetical protein
MYGVAASSGVHLLDADPDLARGIPERALGEAGQHAVARLVTLAESRWDPSALGAEAGSDWLGLLVVDGLIVRRVAAGGRTTCEIIGAGDVLRPWDQDGDYDPLPVSVEWLVMQRAQLAVLDGVFARRIAPWPSITGELIGRVAVRARRLALSAAVTHLPRTHARLLLLFWLMAARWGRVTPDGIALSLPLTHQVLAMLVGSHRPTVTVALQRLAGDGLLLREAHNRWLLTNKAIDALPHRAR